MLNYTVAAPAVGSAAASDYRIFRTLSPLGSIGIYRRWQQVLLRQLAATPRFRDRRGSESIPTRAAKSV